MDAMSGQGRPFLLAETQVKRNRQGQSSITEEKERGFASVFRQQLAVVKNNRLLQRYPYVHVDLHAGSGFNDEVGVIGSPILFCEIADELHVENYLMFCSESDKDRVTSLGKRLRFNHRAFPFFGDNRELCYLLPALLRSHSIQPAQAIGTVLLDPNSIKSEFCWDSLNHLFTQCPRLDCVFNYPATAFKRLKASSKLWFDIDAVPTKLNKSHWYIREPLGCWQFTCLIGRNTGKLKPPSKQFKQWDSDLGKSYRQKVRLTVAEFDRYATRNQRLFDFVK